MNQGPVGRVPVPTHYEWREVNIHNLHNWVIPIQKRRRDTATTRGPQKMPRELHLVTLPFATLFIFFGGL